MEEKLLEAAEIAVRDCMQIEDHESVLVVNNEPNREVAMALKKKSEEVAQDVYQVEYPVGEENGEEPPSFVTDLMKQVDCVFAPTQKSISHTDARREACSSGTRCATLPGITTEEFLNGLDANYDTIDERCQHLYQELQGAERLRIKTERGTDVVFELDKDWMIDNGSVSESGSFTNLPAGEVFTSPAQAEGTIYVDGTAGKMGTVDSEPVEFQLEDGRLTYAGRDEIESRFERADSKSEDDAYNVAEVAIGVNPGVSELMGSILTDEKAEGTFHFAIGDDSSFGGDVSVPIHIDYVVNGPQVYVDGELLDLEYT